MDRSRAHWRGALKQILFGEANAEAARYDWRERTIYLIFGLLSFAYNVAFASLIGYANQPFLSVVVELYSMPVRLPASSDFP